MYKLFILSKTLKEEFDRSRFLIVGGLVAKKEEGLENPEYWHEGIAIWEDYNENFTLVSHQDMIGFCGANAKYSLFSASDSYDRLRAEVTELIQEEVLKTLRPS